MPEYSNSLIEHIISEHVHSERDRRILRRRFIDGIRFEPLAEEFDMSVRGIKYLVSSYQEKLKPYLH